MQRTRLAAISILALGLSPAAAGETLYSVRTLDRSDFTPEAINDDGLFVGRVSLPASVWHAALFDGAELLDLGTLGGTYSQAYGVNASGHVVGESYTDDDDFIRAFVWDGETMDELPSLGGNASAAHAINAGGIVIGYSSVPVTQYGRALPAPPEDPAGLVDVEGVQDHPVGGSRGEPLVEVVKRDVTCGCSIDLVPGPSVPRCCVRAHELILTRVSPRCDGSRCHRNSTQHSGLRGSVGVRHA